MSLKRNSMGGESLAFAVLATGAFFILGLQQPFTAIGISLMGLGWCRWLIVSGRTLNPAAERLQVMRMLQLDREFNGLDGRRLAGSLAPALSCDFVSGAAARWCLDVVSRHRAGCCYRCR